MISISGKEWKEYKIPKRLIDKLSSDFDISENLSKHLSKDIEIITQDIQRNFYQTAEEALSYGLIDQIISKKEGGS